MSVVEDAAKLRIILDNISELPEMKLVVVYGGEGNIAKVSPSICHLAVWSLITTSHIFLSSRLRVERRLGRTGGSSLFVGENCT